MAKEVTNVERETVQPDPYSLKREQVSVLCDDGSKYVFERPADSPQKTLTLARRIKPSGELSTSKGRLPSSVVEQMDNFTERLANLGTDREWSK